jgi:ubiquinone/menaquinone biosynthesis C-methylase UbiE
MGTSIEKVQSFYDTFWLNPQPLRGIFYHRVMRKLRLILEMLDPAEGIALEIGCGSGDLTVALKDKVDLLISCDISRVRVQKAISKVGKSVEFVLCDAMNLPFKAGSVTTIILIEVLEHLYDKGKSLAEIKRVLAWSGRLILTTPNKFHINMQKLVHKIIRKPYVQPQFFDEPLLPCCLRTLIATSFGIRMNVGIDFSVVYFEKIPLPWLQKLQIFLGAFLESKRVFQWLALYQCLLCMPKSK